MTPMTAFIGIDPGLHGALAAIRSDGARLAHRAMPVAGGEIDCLELRDWIGDLSFTRSVYVAVEKVHSMPKQGVASTFKFGCGYGMIRGVCAACGWSITLVTPQAWKREVLKGYSKSDKRGAIQFCKSRWPTLNLVQPGCRKPHDGIADAYCLAEWLRRTW